MPGLLSRDNVLSFLSMKIAQPSDLGLLLTAAGPLALAA
jgi:hypothetical protein